ncbi:MAG: hypothetical protein LBG80_01375 [Bacteroidales bacterium]|jgi:hypothetical protein|nr:hypothetical protein [Bacteroidales bacterium]
MKRIGIIICLIFIINIIRSQEINYIPYYQLVNKAEIARCQQNYDSALVYYWQAFQIVDYILINDLRNFSQCALIEKKDSLIYFVMEQCIKQIVPLSGIFGIDTIFDKYKYTDKWKWCMEQEQANAEKYRKKYECPYTEIMDSLIINDQKVRTKGYWFSRIFPKSKIAKKRRQEWLSVDSFSRTVIDELVAKYDYPNERNGCNNNSCLQMNMVVIYHYDDTNFLRNVEYKALIEGKLSPHCYARKARRVAVVFNMPVPHYTYFKTMTPDEIAQVDKYRYEIGLPSVEEEKIINQCYYEKYLKDKKEKKKKKKH